jgi:hypothetical protein
MTRLRRPGQQITEAQRADAGTTNGAGPDQTRIGAHLSHVRAGSSPRRRHQALEAPHQDAATNGHADLDQGGHETHISTVDVSVAEVEGYLRLRLLAETFWDLQKCRQSIDNRLRRAPVDVLGLLEQRDSLLATEQETGKRLDKLFVQIASPGIRQWQQAHQGMGEHLVARLLGHLGHPCHAFPSHWEGQGDKRKLIHDDPYARSVGQLWQYAGHGGPSRRRKGMSADEVAGSGNPQVKMLAHLLAEAAIKEPGRDKACWQPMEQSEPIPSTTASPSRSKARAKPTERPTGRTPVGAEGQTTSEDQPTPALAPRWHYRSVYEERRRITLDRTHLEPCPPCGPSGKPAQPGTPWSDMHKHMDALRIVGKEILRDLWLAGSLPLAGSES